MVNRIPHIIDLLDLANNAMTIQDWAEENSLLMDEMVSEAAEILVAESDVEYVSLLEMWQGDELVATVDLAQDGLVEALEHNLEHWVEREAYERAARSRDLLKKIKGA